MAPKTWLITAKEYNGKNVTLIGAAIITDISVTNKPAIELKYLATHQSYERAYAQSPKR